MITKNQIKFIHSLAFKKYRDRNNAFLAEGPKAVADLLPHYECELLLVTPDCAPPDFLPREKVCEVSQSELERASLMPAPRGMLAVFRKPEQSDAEKIVDACPKDELILALDGIQDTGNLGTIIRTANWFGIRYILASEETADVYSPKVVQATMGAMARVEVIYADLQKILPRCAARGPIYGTFLTDSLCIYDTTLENGGVLLMGNEGKGISNSLETLVSHRLFIPHFPANIPPVAESLNVAVATALACAEFRRQQGFAE